MLLINYVFIKMKNLLLSVVALVLVTVLLSLDNPNKVEEDVTQDALTIEKRLQVES